MQKVLTFLKKYPLLIPFVLFVLLRIPSLFEGYWYGDEGIHAALGQGIYDGKLIFTQVWDHKPPLMAWIYYLASFVGWDLGLMLVKLASIAFGAASLVYLGKIARLLSTNKLFPFAVTLFMAIALGGVIFEGDIANAEVFFILFNILVFYLLLQSKNPYLVGGLIFLTFVAKPQSCLEAGLILIVWTVSRALNKQAYIKYILKVGLAFLLPLLCFLTVIIMQNSWSGFIDAFFLQNFIYSTESDPGMKILGFSLSSKLTIISTFTGIFIISTTLLKLKKLATNNYLVINLFVIELCLVLFGGRSYPHYLIQLLPGLSLIFATLFLQFKPWQVEFYKNLGLFLLVIMLTLFLFLYKGDSLTTSSFYMASPDYYTSFFRYLTTANKATFQGPFDVWHGTGMSRRIKSFMDYFNENYSDVKNCYIFTENAWTLALSDIPTTNKYVASYHLGFSEARLQEGIKQLNQSEVLVVDTKAPVKYKEFFANISQFKFVEEKEDFQIYIRQK